MNSIILLSSSSSIRVISHSLVIIIFLTSTVYTGNETDHQALQHIKLMITNNPHGALTSWNNSLHFCDWNGVTCGKRHRRVTRVVLESEGLEGLLGNITSLEVIDVSENPLGGSIPQSIGNLKTLGEFDSNFCSNLFGSKEADEMKFIDSMTNCTRLNELDLGDCKFQGVLPRSISNLSNQLQFLALGYNQFHGNIPESIGNLVGPIPDVIGNLSMLLRLGLSFNKLEGHVPSSLGNCRRLLELYLNNNKLIGEIPTQLFQLSYLTKSLDLSQNNLFGSLPSEIGNLNMLSQLYLSDNNLSGNVPSSLGRCASLTLPKCKRTKEHKKSFPLFAIVILIASALSIITCLSYVWRKNKVKRTASQSSTSKRFMKVSYNQLLKATNGFSESNLIGSGGFSSVYKGSLEDDKLVAVKVLHLQNRGAQRSFMWECEAWSNLRHRNLLKIITSCSSVDFQGNDFKSFGI
ncbi:uncharacterized protein LOC143596999 [Bidens hawaiensis]|uniref:uncharacterized protein LOC143596999 n=1 Tax=Bidens hawaiensis TaxID=980011 RepID=UPI00404933AD